MGFLNWLKGEQPGLIESVLNFKDTGQYGEYLTEYALGHNNIPGKSHVFKNLYIPYKEQTTEIDVLMLHEKGIYVFESKNYSGWIFGSAEQRQWTQVLNGRSKTCFYNPILQNKTHIKALQAYLGLPEENFHSFIIFSERCELKKVPADTPQYAILRRQYLVKRLKQDLATRTILFDGESFDAIAEKLDRAHKTEALAQQHIENVKATKQRFSRKS